MPEYVEKEDFDMNNRKQVERSLREHNNSICENCERENRDCKHCDDIDRRSAQDIIDDAGDEKYHLMADEGGI